MVFLGFLVFMFLVLVFGWGFLGFLGFLSFLGGLLWGFDFDVLVSFCFVFVLV